MAHGFIYMLDNDSMPGLIKIGYSTRHPAERVRELSRATACPTNFRLLAWFGHSDAAWAEGRIHHALSAFRVNDSREFFRLTYREAQDILRQWADPAEDAVVDLLLDLEVSVEIEDERIDALGKVAA